MFIFEPDDVSLEIQNAFERLIPQLTKFSQPPLLEDLKRMVKSETIYLFLARYPDQEGEIVGTATLGTFLSPTGEHGWIEDVVVDENFRNKGLGKTLTEACLEKAREIGLKEVNLTSNPNRKAANSLYQSMGFIQRETNLYRYPLL